MGCANSKASVHITLHLMAAHGDGGGRGYFFFFFDVEENSFSSQERIFPEGLGVFMNQSGNVYCYLGAWRGQSLSQTE